MRVQGPLSCLVSFQLQASLELGKPLPCTSQILMHQKLFGVPRLWCIAAAYISCITLQPVLITQTQLIDMEGVVAGECLCTSF